MSKVLTPLLVLVVAVLAVTLFLRGSEVMYAIQSVNSTYATLNLTDVRSTINATCFDKITQSTTTVTLFGGAQEEVICNGTADDTNGYSELGSVAGYFGYTSKNCTQDNRNCSVNNSCTFLPTVINSTAKYWECRFWLWYNADNTTDAGTWTANMTVYSNSTPKANASAFAFMNVSEVLAIGVPSIMQLSSGVTRTVGVNDTYVGSSSCPQCVLNVSNYGNIQMDIMVNVSDWSASGASVCGNLQPDSLHYCNFDNALYSSCYWMNTTATLYNETFDLKENNTPTSQPPRPNTTNTYWGIGIPIGISGSCQTTIWFTAIAG